MSSYEKKPSPTPAPKHPDPNQPEPKPQPKPDGLPGLPVPEQPGGPFNS